MHVGQKKKEQVSVVAGLFVVLPNEKRLSDDL
jgi:hypothetical protein